MLLIEVLVSFGFLWTLMYFSVFEFLIFLDRFFPYVRIYFIVLLTSWVELLVYFSFLFSDMFIRLRTLCWVVFLLYLVGSDIKCFYHWFLDSAVSILIFSFISDRSGDWFNFPEKRGLEILNFIHFSLYMNVISTF